MESVAAEGRKIENLSLEKKKILIVEDQILSSAPLVSIVKLSNCEHDIAVNGEEACYKLRKERYDLLILDWFMPYKNGSETMIDAGKFLSYDLPFILYTGTMPQKVNLPHVEQLKLVDFWEKPVAWRNIFKRFDSIIHRI